MGLQLVVAGMLKSRLEDAFCSEVSRLHTQCGQDTLDIRALFRHRFHLLSERDEEDGSRVR